MQNYISTEDTIIHEAGQLVIVAQADGTYRVTDHMDGDETVDTLAEAKTIFADFAETFIDAGGPGADTLAEGVEELATI